MRLLRDALTCRISGARLSVTSIFYEVAAEGGLKIEGVGASVLGRGTTAPETDDPSQPLTQVEAIFAARRNTSSISGQRSGRVALLRGLGCRQDAHAACCPSRAVE